MRLSLLAFFGCGVALTHARAVASTDVTVLESIPANGLGARSFENLLPRGHGSTSKKHKSTNTGKLALKSSAGKSYKDVMKKRKHLKQKTIKDCPRWTLYQQCFNPNIAEEGDSTPPSEKREVHTSPVDEQDETTSLFEKRGQCKKRTNVTPKYIDPRKGKKGGKKGGKTGAGVSKPGKKARNRNARKQRQKAAKAAKAGKPHTGKREVLTGRPTTPPMHSSDQDAHNATIVMTDEQQVSTSVMSLHQKRDTEYFLMGQIGAWRWYPGDALKSGGFAGCTAVALWNGNEIITAHLAPCDPDGEGDYNEEDLDAAIQVLEDTAQEYYITGPESRGVVITHTLTPMDVSLRLQALFDRLGMGYDAAMYGADSNTPRTFTIYNDGYGGDWVMDPETPMSGTPASSSSGGRRSSRGSSRHG